MPNPNPTLRWGILSTARIGRRNWVGMLESGAATLAAVASRDIATAASFIGEMQATHPWPVSPAALGNYESLLERPDIDAVYIPLPTGLRKEWVLRAAAAGKHVLCEKPCAISAADLREMIGCCEENGVLFMDGVHFMHDPRFSDLRGILDDGDALGEVRRITSAFSFRAPDDFARTNIRSSASLEPTGCLGDLGWYCLRASLWAMDWQMPIRVSGRILETAEHPSGSTAIMAFSGELDFPRGVTAAFYCSFLSPDQKWLDLSGTRGNLRVPDFVAPVAECDTAWEINFQRHAKLKQNAPDIPARLFSQFASSALAEVPDRQWAEYSLKTQIVQDACMLSASREVSISL